MITFRQARQADYPQLAIMKWNHVLEDGEIDLSHIDRDGFLNEFISFIQEGHGYRCYVAEKNGQILSAMYVYQIVKLPKPGRPSQSIAYLTSVFTLPAYRNKQTGSQLLRYIQNDLTRKNCELLFVWPSEQSVSFYQKNGFSKENDIHECILNES